MDKPPQPAYLPTPGSILRPDPDLYTRIVQAPRTLLNEDIIPPRSGLAWRVPAGSIIRLSTPEGPQVGDLNIWSAHNPRERFWASRTRQLHATHVSTGDRLWSCLPYLRPLCTIVADTLGREGKGHWGDGHGRSQWGGRCHDLLGTRCDPYVNKMLTGRTYNHHCHSNLTRAIQPFGLEESDVHDVLNVFQVTSLDGEGRYCMESCPSTPDDYIEFFAETDLLCALSTCPGGDLSRWGWIGAKDGEEVSEEDVMKETCRPIKVQVYSVDQTALAGWEESKTSNYAGKHGL
ncbi:hypothetical protein PENSPDRAFT_601359 [Peniophora sp. CONT]|nr:hypothetical protein PENSPDRAFT_601359 [Peniophora sp. CONT]